MEAPSGLKSSTQLLVEGINPKRVFRVFCQSWGLCLNLGVISDARRHKALVQAYLASKHKPHGSIGVAARRGHWEPKHHAFSELRRFLTNLHGAGASHAPDVTRSDSDVLGESR